MKFVTEQRAVGFILAWSLAFLYIESDLVEIDSLISSATQKQIALAVKNVEEFILCFVQTFILRFRLIHWCPDFNQSPYSLYNSICCLIALNTFN